MDIKPYMLNFIKDFCDLLTKDPNNLEPNNFFIDEELVKIYGLINSMNIERAHQELFKFRALHKDLLELKVRNSQYYNKFSKEISNCPKDNYYGIRLEIQISNTLEFRNIAYTKPKIRPDFLIEFKETELKIECTSRHLNVPKNFDDIIKGFNTTVNQKKDYEFVDENSALFIDSSNLSFYNPTLFSDNHEATINYLKGLIEETDYGNLTTFDWLWNIEGQRYESVYNRIDTQKISAQLQEFMDLIWPMGYYKLGKFASPLVG